ncbi:sugar phosphate isomerase/epimerase family protein [Schlesneria paludicola]|uniref:sugar phosphate isomerase/epimerase family protein n=1 Tax=Schlesneria paludicola TaxID=360056 RepID=UPI00029A32A7|nr:sugar phosphate isomerase/epimerase family protein [Schlesneria paludicola]
MDAGNSGHSLSRRRFMGQGIAGFSALAATAGAQRPLSAADSPLRNGKSHMKLSLAAYSFSKLLTRRGTPEQLAQAKYTLEKFIDFCAEHDLDGTELTAYYFPKEITNEYLMSLKERTFRLGLDISGTAIGNDFCLPPGEARDENLKMCRDWIDYSAAIGAPVIRIFAGNIPKGDSEDAARERCVDAINQSLDYAATRGVCLALENHHGITSTPAQMLKIIRAVKPSPWFGVNFDGGNFHTDDPYADMIEIAPYAINAQVKVDIVAGGKKAPADLARVVKILKDATYRGFLVLEYESDEDPFVAVPRHLKTLRGLIS